MFQTLKRSTSSGALKGMDAKISSTILKPLPPFCQQARDRHGMRDEIIHLHVSFATKIKKIQMKVNESIEQFFTRSIPWSAML